MSNFPVQMSDDTWEHSVLPRLKILIVLFVYQVAYFWDQLTEITNGSGLPSKMALSTIKFLSVYN